MPFSNECFEQYYDIKIIIILWSHIFNDKSYNTTYNTNGSLFTMLFLLQRIATKQNKTGQHICFPMLSNS